MAVNKKRLAEAESRVMPVSSVPTLLHMMVWGRVKSGKTGVACSGPKPALFLAERGQLSVRNVKDLQIYPINPDGSFRRVKWKDIWDFMYYLRYGDHNRETIVIDTMNSLVRIGMKYILKDEEARDSAREPGTPTQPTWGRLQTIMIEVMEELEVISKTKGMHLIYTAQERRLKEEDADVEGIDVVPDFSPGIRSFIVEKPDILARTFIEDEEGDEVVGDVDPEAKLKYGMLFRDADYYVGERVTPIGAKKPWLPRYAYDVTIPKLLKTIERRSSNAPTEEKKDKRRKPKARVSKVNR